MKFKFLFNQKFMNSIFISLIPLIIPSHSLVNAMLISAFLIIVHMLSNISIAVFYNYLENKSYKTLVQLGIVVTISFVFGLLFSLIFKGYSSLFINISCYVAISETLLNTLINVKFNNIKENILGCLSQVAILSVILLVIGFVRELLGSGSVFDFALPLGNLKPISIFSQTAGGLLLLGVLVVLYSLLINKEENK